MKNKFKEYLSLTETQREKIWKEGVFILDANVLLNIFRYSKKSCDELLGILKNHKDNLWLPYQIGMEFFNNRLVVIESVKKGFDDLLKGLSSIDKSFTSALQLNDFKNDTAHNIELLKEDIKAFQKREEKKIQKWKKDFEENDKEKILKEILSLYKGKVGDDYEDDRLNALFSEGAKRYKESIPPGFADRKEKEKRGSRHLYGDLIWWMQVIDYAKDKKCNLVIVTDDEKEDWWYMVSGKTIGPRVELVREFNRKTNGQSFLMYKTHQFMKMAKMLDGANVSASSIKEAESTGSIDYSISADTETQRVYSFYKPVGNRVDVTLMDPSRVPSYDRPYAYVDKDGIIRYTDKLEHIGLFDTPIGPVNLSVSTSGSPFNFVSKTLLDRYRDPNDVLYDPDFPNLLDVQSKGKYNLDNKELYSTEDNTNERDSEKDNVNDKPKGKDKNQK
ncbi:MAG: DUF4935 domain-containing protein [Bacteroidales bacterium]|nr:DUF4935 domain-containing protein [Bacteroidales bacterium]